MIRDNHSRGLNSEIVLSEEGPIFVAIIFNEDKISQYNLSIEKKIKPNAIQYFTFSLSTSFVFKFKITL